MSDPTEFVLALAQDGACAVFVRRPRGAAAPALDVSRLAEALALRGLRLAGVSVSAAAPPVVPGLTLRRGDVARGTLADAVLALLEDAAAAESAR